MNGPRSTTLGAWQVVCKHAPANPGISTARCMRSLASETVLDRLACRAPVLPQRHTRSQATTDRRTDRAAHTHTHKACSRHGRANSQTDEAEVDASLSLALQVNLRFHPSDCEDAGYAKTDSMPPASLAEEQFLSSALQQSSFARNDNLGMKGKLQIR